MKMLGRIDSDADGAVTAARSFLEAACKHVLDATEVSYGTNLDLLQQFRLVSDEVKLTATAEMSRIEQQFYTGTYRVVQALTELRNHAGAAHGKGKLGDCASSAQAKLEVNLAGGLAAFLLRKLDSHLPISDGCGLFVEQPSSDQPRYKLRATDKNGLSPTSGMPDIG